MHGRYFLAPSRTGLRQALGPVSELSNNRHQIAHSAVRMIIGLKPYIRIDIRRLKLSGYLRDRPLGKSQWKPTQMVHRVAWDTSGTTKGRDKGYSAHVLCSMPSGKSKQSQNHLRNHSTAPYRRTYAAMDSMVRPPQV